MKAAEDAWLNPQDYFSAGRARVESVARERIRTKLLIRGVLSRYLSADGEDPIGRNFWVSLSLCSGLSLLME